MFNRIISALLNLLPVSINRLKSSSDKLEKEYDRLLEREKENIDLKKKLNNANLSLNKELKTVERDIKDISQNMILETRDQHEQEIQRIEHEIAGGFAHKLKNLYNPQVMMIDKLERESVFPELNRLVLDLFYRAKKTLSPAGLKRIVPDFEMLQDHTENTENIFKLSSDVIRRNIDLINSFMDYSLQLRSDAFTDLDLTIKNVIRESEDLLEKSHINIRLSLKLDSLVRGDESQYRIIFRNLISNAVRSLKKIRENRQISISSYCTSDGLAEVQISDNGPGIPAKHLNDIFKPFYTTDRRKGSGIGLSLCRKILELYKGSISAGRSAEGGALFIINLPVGEKNA